MPSSPQTLHRKGVDSLQKSTQPWAAAGPREPPEARGLPGQAGWGGSAEGPRLAPLLIRAFHVCHL